MKKVKLIKEVDRLNKENLELREALSTMLKDGNEFEKLFVRTKYQQLNDLNYVMWRGDKHGNVERIN